jgi:HD-GYP domain-containing protein (c-di-GMP phosphodiesterase class II)
VSLEKEAPRKFQRRLLQRRGELIEPLISLLPQEDIKPVPFERSHLLLGPDDVAVILLDRNMHGEIADSPPEGIGEGAERVGVILIGDRSGAADPFWPPRVYFSLPENSSDHHLARAIRSVFRFLEERTISARSRRNLAERTREIEALNQVGIALAAETEPERLIEAILSRARELTQAEAGSLYLVEERDGRKCLCFRAAQNDSVRFNFEEHTIPLDTASLAGYVATRGEVLRLEDVYELPPGEPYGFNDSFDRTHGYRTRSMLVVPMKNPQGTVVGVLQLMNRRRRVIPDMATTAIIRMEKVPFDEQNEEIARSLASQAAVALENARLTGHLKKLFEGFVEASVTAIEQRDPTTSGHSERVAVLTCALAEATSRVHTGPYASFNITPAELTALRYAAVLHDFGKVGVREWVLVKAKKLPPGRLEVLRERFEKARLAVAAQIWEKAARGDLTSTKAAREIAARYAKLDEAWKAILAADEPTVLAKETAPLLEQASRVEFSGPDGAAHRLLLPEEQAYLSIPKGSLNETERREIESHVTQTYKFLTRIPWTPELSRVPELAYLHHEKLDGSGYPRGLTSEQLPPPGRMMTICDIFDALSASDRPYKRAVPREAALDILRSDAKRGAVDGDILDVFIEAKVFEKTHPRGI